MRDCVVKDLEVIGRVLYSYTGHHFFSSSYNKAQNTNIIGRAFEGNNMVEEMHCPAKKSALPKPDSLLDMCKNKILQNKFLVQCLPVSYARVLYSIQKYDYIQNCHIKRAALIP